MSGFQRSARTNYVAHGATALNTADGPAITSLHRKHRAVEFEKFLAKIDVQVPEVLRGPQVRQRELNPVILRILPGWFRGCRAVRARFMWPRHLCSEPAMFRRMSITRGVSPSGTWLPSLKGHPYARGPFSMPQWPGTQWASGVGIVW